MEAAMTADLNHPLVHSRNDKRTGGGGSVMINDINDAVILSARLFLAALFLIFGWRKLRDYSGTVSQMVRDGAPMPVLATAVAISWSFRLRSRSLSARSRVHRLYSWFYTR
jgi:hypothetical protein